MMISELLINRRKCRKYTQCVIRKLELTEELRAMKEKQAKLIQLGE